MKIWGLKSECQGRLYSLFWVGRVLLERRTHSPSNNSASLEAIEILYAYISIKRKHQQMHFVDSVECRCHTEEHGINSIYCCTECNDLQTRSKYVHETRFNSYDLSFRISRAIQHQIAALQ